MISVRPVRLLSNTLRSAVALLAACAALAGCGSRSTAPVPEPSPTGSAAASCAAVMSALPKRIAGLDRSAETANTASWGDPAITLRCGVPRPQGLTSTSRCDEVDAVGWYTEEFTEARRFTTIGRVGYIEVTVPAVHSPAADALVDLAPAVGKMASVTPCQ
ncbi:MAG: DUF3515 domain-containing protein [Acidipropionibacterium sp.]|jgi:hypothetical protein|nr:DUF3515 domain-containing protein [Acidipropionibacterium sp.]